MTRTTDFLRHVVARYSVVRLVTLWRRYSLEFLASAWLIFCLKTTLPRKYTHSSRLLRFNLEKKAFPDLRPRITCVQRQAKQNPLLKFDHLFLDHPIESWYPLQMRDKSRKRVRSKPKRMENFETYQKVLA